MAAIDFGIGANTPTGDLIPAAIVKLSNRLIIRGFDPGIVFGDGSSVADAMARIDIATARAVAAYVPPVVIPPIGTPTPGPTPTPTPAPAFTTQPAISPSSGTVGQVYTLTKGTASNATSLAGRVFLDGAQVAGDVSSYTSTAAGIVTYENTATGPTSPPAVTSVTATVAAEPVTPTLATLTLSPATATVGTSYNGVISGATSGSVITGAIPAGLTLNSAARTITGTPTTASSAAFALTETLAGATGSPKTNSIAFTVATAPVTPSLNALTVSPSSATVGTAYSGTIAGLTSGSTVALSGAGSAGLSIAGAVINGTPTTAGAINLVETLAGANGSPRTSSGVVTVAAATVGPLTFTGSPSPATTNRSYSFAPEATGGSGAKTYAFTGATPPSALGGTFNTATGEIGPTFTIAGTVSGTITVTDASGSVPLSVSIPVAAGPGAVPNLLIDLDAAEALSLFPPLGPVLTATDASGGVLSATQPTLAFRPISRLRRINNRNALDFPAATSPGTSFTVNVPQGGGYTLFMVVQVDTLSQAKILFNGPTGALAMRIATTGIVQVLRQGSTTLQNGNTPIVRGAPQLLTIQAGTFGTRIRINGVADASNTTDAALTQPITSLGGLTSPLDGVLGAFIAYSGDMAGADLAAMESSLMAKWLTAPAALPVSPITSKNGRIFTWGNGEQLAWAA